VSLLAPWLLFPAVLGVLALGCGLLLERATAVRLPGVLLAPCGVAVIIVVGEFATLGSATASFATPSVVTLAVAGLFVGLTRDRFRQAAVPLAVGAVVFLAYGAPVLLSGEATFAGYIKLDDTATFLALTDRVLEHGHNVAGLAPSSYEATLSVNLVHGYPVGALLPFGIARNLVGVDGAWVYQPYLAFLASMLALVLFELARRVVSSRRLCAVTAAVAAQPALLYGFALWGGIKELCAAPIVALIGALASTNVARPRHLLPLATAVAALLGVLSVGGAVWLVVPVAILALVAWRCRALRPFAGLAATTVLLSLPTLVDARSFLSPATAEAVRSGTVLGNLARPLTAFQIFGIWPNGDFRFDPSDRTATWILIATVAFVGLIGVGVAARARAWTPLLYVGSAVGACVLLTPIASPWVVAKAYAIASPAILLAALLGCGALVMRRRMTEGVVGLVAVACGVLWSNVLAYHDVNLAPREQLRELEWIGHSFAGDGPALMTEYQPYGVRHFLRSLEAEGASELRRRPIPLRNGALLDKGESVDLAQFDPAAVRVYQTLVLRRSPLASGPPNVYRLVWRGRFYDVWQVSRGEPASLVSVAPRANARCPRVTIGLARSLRRAVRFPASGRYEIWMGGSFRNRLAIVIDGRSVATRSRQLNNAGQYTLVGTTRIAAGLHAVEVRYSRSSVRPGSGGDEYGFGPLILTRAGDVCR
jgi:hypothetical protein